MINSFLFFVLFFYKLIKFVDCMFFKGKKREMFSKAKFIAFTGASSLSILITDKY